MSVEWCIPRAGDVGAVPAVQRLLRVVRRDPGVLAVDHLPLLHPLRVRGHGARHILLRQGEAKVSSGNPSLCYFCQLVYLFDCVIVCLFNCQII